MLRRIVLTAVAVVGLPALILSTRVQPVQLGLIHADLHSGLFAAPDPTSPLRRPLCTTANPHGDFGFHAILVQPQTNRFDPDMSPGQFRYILESEEEIFYRSGLEAGGKGTDLVFDCDNSGQIEVDELTLPLDGKTASYYDIVTALQGQSFDRDNRKYAIWFNGAGPLGICGQADIPGDDSPDPSNRANQGPDYAIAFACYSMLHEIGHTLGAVALTAPHSTGNGHCWDGDVNSDVMCYNDGGPQIPTGGVVTVCKDGLTHFDCNHDDYFDAGTPGPDNYLADHWNIGACYDNFIVNYGCPGAPAASMQQLPALAAPLRQRISPAARSVTVLLHLSEPALEAGTVTAALASDSAPVLAVKRTASFRAGATTVELSLPVRFPASNRKRIGEYFWLKLSAVRSASISDNASVTKIVIGRS